MSQQRVAVCANCRHYRVRPKPELFGPAALRNPQVLKAKLEWEQQDQARRFTEERRFVEELPFTYEPHHYPWCDAFTPYDAALPERIEAAVEAGDRDPAPRLARESQARGEELLRRARAGDGAALAELAEHGRATFDPVQGKVIQVYALCAHMNPKGRCPVYEPRKAQSSSGPGGG